MKAGWNPNASEGLLASEPLPNQPYYWHLPVSPFYPLPARLSQWKVFNVILIFYLPHPLYPPLYDMDIYSYDEGEGIVLKGLRPFNYSFKHPEKSSIFPETRLVPLSIEGENKISVTYYYILEFYQKSLIKATNFVQIRWVTLDKK